MMAVVEPSLQRLMPPMRATRLFRATRRWASRVPHFAGYAAAGMGQEFSPRLQRGASDFFGRGPVTSR